MKSFFSYLDFECFFLSLSSLLRSRVLEKSRKTKKTLATRTLSPRSINLTATCWPVARSAQSSTKPNVPELRARICWGVFLRGEKKKEKVRSGGRGREVEEEQKAPLVLLPLLRRFYAIRSRLCLSATPSIGHACSPRELEGASVLGEASTPREREGGTCCEVVAFQSKSIQSFVDLSFFFFFSLRARTFLCQHRAASERRRRCFSHAD